ncbi:MAG: DUF6580 family putative transport protein [Terriglobales bacterium]
MLMLLFVLGAVGMRFLPHAWNFTPVIAMLLLCGVWMKPKHLWVPIAALAASDFALNLWVYHAPGRLDQYFTWAAWLVVLGLALVALRGRLRVPALLGTTVASSTLFFLISNLGVWADGTMYAHSWTGLITCYTLGLPFYRTAMAGDLVYVTVFFGLYALIQHRHLVRSEAV